jgi:hypothetical protein
LDENSEEKINVIRRLETYKNLLLNGDANDEDEEMDPQQTSYAIQCLDYYFLNKWTTQLREAFDTNALDVVVQRVLREIDDHSDVYQLSASLFNSKFYIESKTNSCRM